MPSSVCAVLKPAPLADTRWLAQHEVHKHLASSCAKHNESSLLFIGASIVQFLPVTGKDTWARLLAATNNQKGLNLGIAGDRVENVLWRVMNGALDAPLRLKFVLILCGSNNVNNSPAEIATSLIELAKQISVRQPAACVILIRIPPRGMYPNSLRDLGDAVNEILAARLTPLTPQAVKHDRHSDQSLANIFFYNFPNSLFVADDDGRISSVDLPDYLHFSDSGYAKMINPLIELMKVIVKDFAN